MLVLVKLLLRLRILKAWMDRILVIRSKRKGDYELRSYGNILTIAYTLREIGNDQTKVRIISARRASRKEREAYKEGFGKD